MGRAVATWILILGLAPVADVQAGQQSKGSTLDLQRRAVQRGIGKALQRPASAQMRGATTLYRYEPGAIYAVYGQPGRVVNLMLEPGERLSGDVHGGDTVQWQIAQSRSGSGTRARTHLLIKARDANIGTNVVVPTNRRVYHLLLYAAENFYMPSVAWTYGQDEADPRRSSQRAASRVKSRLTAGGLAHTDRHNDGYRVQCATGRGRTTYKKCFDPAFSWWHPSVYDNGAKTILRFPPAILRREAPVVYVLEPGEARPRLVNYRVLRNYYVIDRLFDMAELRLGRDKRIRITRVGRRVSRRHYRARCGRVVALPCPASIALPTARDDGRRTYIRLPKGVNSRALIVTPYVGTQPVKTRWRRRGNTLMLPGLYTRIQLELPGGRSIRLVPELAVGGRS